MAQYTIDTTTLTSKTSRWGTMSPDWSTSGGYIVVPTGGVGYYFLSMDDVGSVSGTTEILIQAQTQDLTGTQMGVVLFGQAGATSGYTLVFNGGTDLYFIRLDSGSEDGASTTSGSFTHAINTDYWMRAQITGTTVRVRAWAGAIGSEPGTWTVSTTDSTYTSGYVGIFARLNLFGSKTFKYISVGTSGDAAPSPSGGSTPVRTLMLLGVG